ncbi:MAG: hypothetical protein V3T72_16590 [Thermoanaerobaculia bacterium]
MCRRRLACLAILPSLFATSVAASDAARLIAAKTLAATMVDLYADAEYLTELRREFEDKTAGHVYVPYIPEGPPPVSEN